MPAASDALTHRQLLFRPSTQVDPSSQSCKVDIACNVVLHLHSHPSVDMSSGSPVESSNPSTILPGYHVRSHPLLSMRSTLFSLTEVADAKKLFLITSGRHIQRRRSTRLKHSVHGRQRLAMGAEVCASVIGRNLSSYPNQGKNPRAPEASPPSLQPI